MMASALAAGGDTSVDMICRLLEHAIDVLEQCAASSPRKARRSIRDVIARAEAFVDGVDTAWSDRVSQCDETAIATVSEQLCAVQSLSGEPGSTASSAASVVSSVLESLDRLGDVVLQVVGLCGESGSGCSEAYRMRVFELVRCLERDAMESVSPDEVCAYRALATVAGDEARSVGERASACMGAFSLGCRNGVAVVRCDEFAVVDRGFLSSLRPLCLSECDVAEAARLSVPMMQLWTLQLDGSARLSTDARPAVETLQIKALSKQFATRGRIQTSAR